jgi:hypothetical protein
MIAPREKGSAMWRYFMWLPAREIYTCFQLFVLRRYKPDAERQLRYLLARNKVLRRRLKAYERSHEK